MNKARPLNGMWNRHPESWTRWLDDRLRLPVDTGCHHQDEDVSHGSIPELVEALDDAAS